MENREFHIILDPEEFSVLSDLVYGSDPIAKIPLGDGRMRLEMTPELADDLRDRCGEKLQVAGFDEIYAANAVGTILESLIDKLFIDTH